MLTYSHISLDPVSHTYMTADGEARQGITGMLHRQLFPDMYADIPQDTLEKAAERGKEIHTLAEFADEFDLSCDNGVIKAYRDAVSKQGWQYEASEYIVTDGETFASPIDKVYRLSDTDYILADIKTTSRLNKEYVQWQLSIYAYLFELVNPTLHAAQLYAVWLRDGKCKIVEVQRIADDVVKALLEAEKQGQQFVNPLSPADNTLPEQYRKMEEQIIWLDTQLKEIKESRDRLMNGLKAEMEKHNVKRWETDSIRLTYVEPTVKDTFDATAFRADHPDLYRQYIKQTTTKSSIRLTQLNK